METQPSWMGQLRVLAPLAARHREAQGRSSQWELWQRTAHRALRTRRPLRLEKAAHSLVRSALPLAPGVQVARHANRQRPQLQPAAADRLRAPYSSPWRPANALRTRLLMPRLSFPERQANLRLEAHWCQIELENPWPRDGNQ